MVARLNFLDENAPGKARPGNNFSKQLCFLILILAGFIVVLYEVFLLYGLRKEQNTISEQLCLLETETSRLDSELAQMADRRERGEQKLRFVLGGAPVAEILSALAFLRSEGVTADELRLTANEFVLIGHCESRPRALEFASALSSSGLFSSAGEPDITDNEDGSGLSFTFTGTMTPPRSPVLQEAQD